METCILNSERSEIGGRGSIFHYLLSFHFHGTIALRQFQVYGVDCILHANLLRILREGEIRGRMEEERKRKEEGGGEK